MGIKLVFMGSAEFALPSLNRLFETGYSITGVITQPDKPSGRGYSLQGPPVKQCAFDLHLPVFQPETLKAAKVHALFEALEPDIIVVVAYGKILQPWLLQLPQHGCINLHGSLLPKYRGAAPVHWAIANGETVTGVCTMRLDEGVDTGPVYLCRETAIDPDETVQVLSDRLACTGAGLLAETLQGILDGRLQPHPQDNSKATYAPVLKKEDGYIDWSLPAAAIHDRVRAFNLWPGPVTRFRGTICKILKARNAQARQVDGQPAAPGTLVVTKASLAAVCGDGQLLEILTIQPENRKPVSGPDFANGARIQAGEKFQSILDNSKA